MNKKTNQFEDWKKNIIKSFSKYSVLDQPFPEWENFLTLDCWKDWRNKILDFQTEKELDFYTERLRVIANVIWNWKKEGETKARYLFMNQYRYWYDEKHGAMEGMDPNEIIKQEESRLQNISWEDWQNEYKFSSKYTKISELSTGEMLDDPWFSEAINKLFGLESGKPAKSKKTKQQEHDTSTFQYSKITGELTIFSSEINFNKFYQKKINQYQAEIDYKITEEKIISVHNVYNVFSNQLKKDIFLSIQQGNSFFSDVNADDVKSIKIIVKKYADYQREEGDKWHKEINEKFFKNEVVERKINEPSRYENWSKERLIKEIKRLTSFIDKVRNNDETLTQAQRENSGLVVQNLEKCLNQAKLSLNGIDKENNNNENNNNPFPILPIVGTVGVVALLGLMVYKLSSKRIKK